MVPLMTEISNDTAATRALPSRINLRAQTDSTKNQIVSELLILRERLQRSRLLLTEYRI